MLRWKRLKTYLFTLSFFLISTVGYTERSYLYTWDTGSGTTMPGWTWYPEGNAVLTSGVPGFQMDIDESGPFGGGNVYLWGTGSRNFYKGDYGNENLVEIITTDRSPSTDTGGSFRIYDTGESTR